MLKDADVKEESDKWELVCEKRFKKLGYRVEWLDKGKAKRMPEFLVSDGAGPVLVCEAKTVLAGKPLPGVAASVSLMDDDLPTEVTYDLGLDRTKIDEDLGDSTEKYKRLLKLRKHLAGVPLVVAFRFDFFAGSIQEYPECMGHFPLVSGVLTLVKDRKIKQWAHEMSLEELKRRIDEEDSSGSPPNTKEFELMRSPTAMNPLPTHFVKRCIERRPRKTRPNR